MEQRYRQKADVGQDRNGANLAGRKFFLIFLPSSLDTVSRLRAVTSFLLCGFIRVVLFSGLLRVEIAEPFGVLLQ
jgi:hypothetical protein